MLLCCVELGRRVLRWLAGTVGEGRLGGGVAFFGLVNVAGGEAALCGSHAAAPPGLPRFGGRWRIDDRRQGMMARHGSSPLASFHTQPLISRIRATYKFVILGSNWRRSVTRSPDGAKRNPGFSQLPMNPGFRCSSGYTAVSQ